ncbi:MAG: hypothetical protein FWC26_15530 [Fibromonadales bacterium]|nr:hypothetical protein [Fibromonadales bacterium]
MNATQAYPQAYRTTCVPSGNRLDTIIPSEYIGQKIEVIVFPQYEEPEYNEETLAAMQEARDIMSGKIKAKTYSTVEEMHADILAEEDN